MIIHDKQRKILKLFIRNTDKYIENNDIRNLLGELLDFSMRYGFDHEKGRNNWLGRKLDKLYDEIYWQNH